MKRWYAIRRYVASTSSAFALAIAAIAIPASAYINAPAVFTPLTPTDREQVRATFDTFTSGCGTTVTTAVSGSVVRTTLDSFSCILGPPPFIIPEHADFGPLPAGTYTYELWESYEGGPPELRFRQQLIVSAAPLVPTLSDGALALLALMFACIGLVSGTPR